MGRTQKQPDKGMVAVAGDPTLHRWGRNIQLFRSQLGLSQQELAERLGVSYPTVNRWEAGKMEPRRKHKRALTDELIGERAPESALFS